MYLINGWIHTFWLGNGGTYIYKNPQLTDTVG